MRTAKTVAQAVLVLLGLLTILVLPSTYDVRLIPFLSFTLLTLLSAHLQIASGEASIPAVWFSFALCLGELGSVECTAVGACAALLQTLFGPRRGGKLPWTALANIGGTLVAMRVAAMVTSRFHSFGQTSLDVAGSLLSTVVLFALCSYHLVLQRSQDGERIVSWYAKSGRLMAVTCAAAATLRIAGQFVGWQTGLVIAPVLYLLYRSLSLYLAQLRHGKRHAEELAELNLRTIEALAMAIDAKDQTTHDHLARVQVYAMEIGRELGLHEAELQALRAAALLHDIGKLAVPESIISKPGRLTPDEFEKMKIHPVVGAEIVERVKFPYPVAPIVRSHHEKWDGSGYPSGLRGMEIPIGARILAVVDTLDALASDRQYRKAMPLDKAMQVIVKESGGSFDPKVVEVLERRYVELERTARQTSGGDATKLSLDLKIERGLAPAAGFAESEFAAPDRKQARLDSIATTVAARQQAQLLVDLAANPANTVTIEEALSVFSVRLRQLISFDTFAVYCKSGGVVVPVYITGDDTRVFSNLRIPIGQGLSGWVVENGKPILNGNPSVEPGYRNDASLFTKLRSAAIVPLRGKEGIVGAMSLYHHEASAFSQEQINVLLGISGKVSSAIRCLLQSETPDLGTNSDAVLDVPDAHEFFEETARLIAGGERGGFALILVQLREFQALRARMTQGVLPTFLRQIYRSLAQNPSQHLLVAHLGEGEFALLVPRTALESIPGQFAKWQRSLRTVLFQIPDAPPLVDLAFGVSVYPENGQTTEELLADADRKMSVIDASLSAASGAMPQLASASPMRHVAAS